MFLYKGSGSLWDQQQWDCSAPVVLRLICTVGWQSATRHKPSPNPAGAAQLQWDSVPSPLCQPCLSFLNRVLQYFIAPGSSCSSLLPSLPPSRFCAALPRAGALSAQGKGLGGTLQARGCSALRHFSPGGSWCCPCPSCSPTLPHQHLHPPWGACASQSTG